MLHLISGRLLPRPATAASCMLRTPLTRALLECMLLPTLVGLGFRPALRPTIFGLLSPVPQMGQRWLESPKHMYRTSQAAPTQARSYICPPTQGLPGLPLTRQRSRGPVLPAQPMAAILPLLQPTAVQSAFCDRLSRPRLASCPRDCASPNRMPNCKSPGSCPRPV